MAAPAAVVAIRMLVVVFGCVGIFAFAYGFAMDRYTSCWDVNNRWLLTRFADFYVNVAVIAAWVMYKESSWIMAAVYTVLLVVFGSIGTCGYVLMQLFKLSPEESSTNLFYSVLVRHHKSGHRKGLSVVTARVIFSAVGCLMLGTFVFMYIVNGSPFSVNVYTPCMIGTTIDLYANIAFLSMWIVYKESSWISALFWILALVCTGCPGTCAYIARQAFHLSPEQPFSLILFNRKDRNTLSSEPLLIAHSNV